LQLQSDGSAPSKQLSETELLWMLLEMRDAVLTQAQASRHRSLRELAVFASSLEQLPKLQRGDERLGRLGGRHGDICYSDIYSLSEIQIFSNYL
jgi:hypothetical protein